MGMIVSVPFILPESCRWLMAMGESEKLQKILKSIAKMNKKDVPDHVYIEAISMCKKQVETNETKTSYTYIDLFRNPNMRKITILVTILWMLISLVFDTTVRNISNLDSNVYVSFMVATSLELPADLLTIVGLNWLGRRC